MSVALDTLEVSAGYSGLRTPGGPMAEPRTLVIGDVHGHWDRLYGLLHQEGIIGFQPDLEPTRINHDARVIQLGDLGHFGKDGSPTGDRLCWDYADKWGLEVLWGNHDRALFDPTHAFTGMKMDPETKHRIKLVEHAGRLKWAAAAHGHLITHAGLHLAFKDNHIPGLDKTNPYDVAHYINCLAQKDQPGPNAGILHAVSYTRGGNSPAGGILWRDISEKLYMGFPQIFGHSADKKRHQVRWCTERHFTRKPNSIPAHQQTISYCIDIGGKGNRPGDECLAGIWLPEKKIVTWNP